MEENRAKPVERRPERRRLGEALVEAGAITPHQLSAALDVQRREGGRLGEILVRLGYISELDLATTLAH
ncbi:MAG: hypothetical protein IRY95_08225, partial [Clostridia bacterium]|nr:hypothetical protein [Clostridia bacterium]